MTGAIDAVVEHWRPIPGFDEWYEVSDFGRVRSWRTKAKFCVRSRKPRDLDGRDEGKGYLQVKLTHPVLGKVAVAVHHAVLAAFVRHRPHGLVCDHINADRKDNRVENLRWVTLAENVRFAADAGRMDGRPGARTNSSLREADVRSIRRLRVSGTRLSEIAQRFNVSVGAVSRICLGKTWREVQS